MPDNQYTVLGNAQAYQEEFDRVRSGRTPPPHRSLADAQAALRPQIAAVEDAARTMPRQQRLDEVVAEVRLDVSRLAKSYHPDGLLRAAGLRLRGVGTWVQELTGARARRARRERATTDTGRLPDADAAPERMDCRSLLVSGTEQAFATLHRIIDRPARAREADVIGMEHIRIPTAAERLAIRHADAAQTTVEIVFYAWDRPRRDEAIAGVRRVLADAGVGDDRIRVKSYTDGPTFIAAIVPRPALAALSELNYLRLTRTLPRVQLTRTAVGMHVPAPPPHARPVVPAAEIAVFDGGVAPLPHFQGVMHYSELTSVPCPPELLEHGTAVVGAAIYGEMIPDQPLPQPRCQVHAFRVLPDPLGSDLELWGVIDRLEDRVPRLPAEVKVINLSFGPQGPIDDVPSRFTYAIDQLSYTYDKLFVTAVGNWGEDPDHALRRIQAPSDAVNAIAVGAFTRDPTTGGRLLAPYSSIGPGRAGCARKPELLGFGGCPRVPFYTFDVLGGRMQGTMGTSYAAPPVAALTGQLITGAAISTQGGRALLLHAAHPVADGPFTGIGVTRDALEDILACTPTRVSVLYQGVLVPRRGWRLPFLLPPGLHLPGKVRLAWTLVYCSETNHAARDEYTLGGVDVQLRPNSRVFVWRPPRGSTEKPQSLHETDDAAAILALESAGWERSRHPDTNQRRRTEAALRASEAKWDTVVPGDVTKYGSGLDDPALTVSFVGRHDWDRPDNGDEDLIQAPFAAVLTVQAERYRGDLYAEVARAYNQLQALAIANRIAVPIPLGRHDAT